MRRPPVSGCWLDYEELDSTLWPRKTLLEVPALTAQFLSPKFLHAHAMLTTLRGSAIDAQLKSLSSRPHDTTQHPEHFISPKPLTALM